MTKKEKLVKMKNVAPSPRWVPGVGNVEINEDFDVPESQAKELEEGGQFKRVTKGGKA